MGPQKLNHSSVQTGGTHIKTLSNMTIDHYTLSSVMNRMSNVDLANHIQYSGFNRQARNGHQDGISGTDVTDLDKYQFWPMAMAMGSLVGREFCQVGRTFPRITLKADEIAHRSLGFARNMGQK